MSPKHRILIVDDDRVMTTLLSTLVRSAGHDTLIAGDSLQGYTLAVKERPALIVTDMQMPAGGGKQLLQRLAANDRTRDIPIMVVTGSVGPEHEQEILQAGARQVVFKPIDHTQCLAALESVLGKTPT